MKKTKGGVQRNRYEVQTQQVLCKTAWKRKKISTYADKRVGYVY